MMLMLLTLIFMPFNLMLNAMKINVNSGCLARASEL